MCIGLNLEILGQCCDCNSLAVGENCRSHRFRSTIPEVYLYVPEQPTSLINAMPGSNDKIIPDKPPSRNVFLIWPIGIGHKEFTYGWKNVKIQRLQHKFEWIIPPYLPPGPKSCPGTLTLSSPLGPRLSKPRCNRMTLVDSDSEGSLKSQVATRVLSGMSFWL